MCFAAREPPLAGHQPHVVGGNRFLVVDSQNHHHLVVGDVCLEDAWSLLHPINPSNRPPSQTAIPYDRRSRARDETWRPCQKDRPSTLGRLSVGRPALWPQSSSKSTDRLTLERSSGVSSSGQPAPGPRHASPPALEARVMEVCCILHHKQTREISPSPATEAALFSDAPFLARGAGACCR